MIPNEEDINKAVEDELRSILGNSGANKYDKAEFIQTCLRLAYMRGWIEGQAEMAEVGLK